MKRIQILAITLSSFVGMFFLNIQQSYANTKSLTISIKIPEFVLVNVGSTKFEKLKTEKISKKKHTGSLFIGSTTVEYFRTSANYAVVLTLDPSLPISSYLSPDGRFKLVSTSSPENYILMSVTCVPDDHHHAHPLYYDSSIFQYDHHEHNTTQSCTIEFELPESALNNATQNTLYKTVLAVEIKSIN